MSAEFDAEEGAAVLPVTGDAIAALVESRLTGSSALPERRDQRLISEVSVLSRGDAWIVPLAWKSSRLDTVSEKAQAWPARADLIWREFQSYLSYAHGSLSGIDIGPAPEEHSYSAELARTGARRADWWHIGESAVVLVVYGDPVPAPFTAMAVHVVPAEWAAGRGAARIPETNLAWTWADLSSIASAE